MRIELINMLKGKGSLAENEVKDVLKKFDINTTKYVLVKDVEDLEKIDLEFPVAFKVCSSKILHKTDVGGVKLDINDKNELIEVFKHFRMKFPKENFLIDQMVEKGIEMIIGLVQDPAFGLCIMFGIGGIFTEIYEDVVFRVIPIDKYDAEEMIGEIKGKKILEGFRNILVNKNLIINLLVKVSKMGEELVDHIDQLDLNPVFVSEKDICVVDAKLILK